MIMKRVKLTRQEVLMGANIGVMRRIASYTKLHDNHRSPRGDDDTWDRDIEGACAELAFAKFANVFWDGSIGSFHAPDVGNIQVRSTKYQSGCLIVRADDTREHIYVLVCGVHPTYKMIGWMYGHEAMQEEWRKDEESWFVPQTCLHDLQSLSMKNISDN